jgi:hypothetical protein
MSPSPVAPHAPISSSAYAEDPVMGPSPTLQSRKNFHSVFFFKKAYTAHPH